MKIVRLDPFRNPNNNFTIMSLTKIAKKSEKTLLGQIFELSPSSQLNKIIAEHESDKHCHKYKTYDQLVSMMLGQLYKCHTLRGDRSGHQHQPKISQRYRPKAESSQIHHE